MLWMLAGEKSKHGIKSLWRGVGISLLLVLCGWTISKQEWVGFAAASIVLCCEVYWVVRVHR